MTRNIIDDSNLQFPTFFQAVTVTNAYLKVTTVHPVQAIELRIGVSTGALIRFHIDRLITIRTALRSEIMSTKQSLIVTFINPIGTEVFPVVSKWSIDHLEPQPLLSTCFKQCLYPSELRLALSS